MTQFLDTQQACEALHRHRNTLYKLIRSGELPATKLGAKYIFNLTDIEQFLRAQTQKGN